MTEENNNKELGENLPQNDENFRKIVLMDDKGNKIEYTVLFAFDSEDYGKSYVLVYPTVDEEKGVINVEAYSYTLDPEGSGKFGDLTAIEDDEEMDMIEEVLNTFLDDENLNQG
ncbi:MAG: DUF1292 domain-containing protein [Lactobacillaceae bacterium]